MKRAGSLAPPRVAQYLIGMSHTARLSLESQLGIAVTMHGLTLRSADLSRQVLTHVTYNLACQDLLLMIRHFKQQTIPVLKMFFIGEEGKSLRPYSQPVI